MWSHACILTGATASGKSGRAIELAERLGAEILSADSMTLYRGMNIGTAKPSAADLARVPHHLIDCLEPWESANVATWLSWAEAAHAAIRTRGRRTLIVGGTPFYLKALLHGLFDSPPVNLARRAELEQADPAELYARLQAIDPPSALKLHPNDVRRVVRAIEVYELTGQPISQLQQSWAAPATPIPLIQLDWPREELYRRIDTRVEAMFEAGWIDEVRELSECGHPLSREAGQALGYKEIAAELAGAGPGWPATIAFIQQKTRQFAKRQLTWFRSLPGCRPVPGDLPGDEIWKIVRDHWPESS
ncbi:MAG: tRNA (adenosine(37)-N6)-dimethylallyltransferase MiaA [Gemmataceae bacterium]